MFFYLHYIGGVFSQTFFYHLYYPILQINVS